MEVCFDNKNLLDLYGKGRNRKYPLQPSVYKKFSMRIQQLEAAYTIYDLWKTPSLNFEKMENLNPPYSVRVDKGWRLEFDVEWTNKEQTTGVIFIKDLTNHYRD